MPFAQDRDRLRLRVESVVGEGRVQRLRFRGTPLRGTSARPGRARAPYVPPPPETPVLLLTDLGIGRPEGSRDPATAAEWRAFADVVRRAGCPAVALVPYAPARWPHDLGRALAIVPWDRSTDVATVFAHRGRLDTRPRR